MIVCADLGEIFFVMKKRSSAKYNNSYLWAAFLAEMVGDGADRCLWQMQGGGGRKNTKRTRGYLCRRCTRRVFFRGTAGSNPVK